MASTNAPKHGNHFAGAPASQDDASAAWSAQPAARAAAQPGVQGAANPSTVHVVTSDDVERSNATGVYAPITGVQESLPTMRAQGTSAAHISSRTAAATRRAVTGNVQRDPRAHKRTNVPGIIAGLVVVAALLAGVYFVVLPRLGLTGGDDSTQSIVSGQDVEVTIADGSGASDIAQALYDKGLITSTSEFLTYVRRAQVESVLKSGTYTFTTGESIEDIVEQLQNGSAASALTLTVPEGYTVAKTAAVVEESLGISADEFIAQAKASYYVNDYPFLSVAASEGHDTLEGYLFPKTYGFDEGVTADTVIRTMLSQYQTEVASLDLTTKAAELSSRYGITVTEHDILTVASLIEREAGAESDRGNIASAIMNRLKAGMALNVDATTEYELGHAPTQAELAVDSEYNTYTRAGLTPTPICSPGLASLTAAATPNDTEYLYWFTGSDGVTDFAETLEEHNANVNAG